MYRKIDKNVPVAETVTVALSGQTSDALDLNDFDVVGLITPSTFDGTTITFTGSTDNSTFYTVAASNAAATAYTVTTTASILTPINPQIFAGVRYVKAVCGSAQTTTATDLVFLLRKRT